MKKFAIACAVVLATTLSLISCGDTNYCYEVTTTYTFLGQTLTTNYKTWCTSNELDALIAENEAALEKTGVSQERIKTRYKLQVISCADIRNGDTSMGCLCFFDIGGYMGIEELEGLGELEDLEGL